MGFLRFDDSTVQSRAERDVASAGLRIHDNSNADDWQNYITALIADGQLERAERELERAKAFDPDVERGQQLLFAEAALLDGQGDVTAAVEILREVIEESIAAYKYERDYGPDEMNWAQARGIHRNVSAGLGHIIFYELGEGNYDAALYYMDLFLEHYPRDAGIMIERAEVRAQMGDAEGARADFEEALRFMPHDERAHAGLEQLGGAE